MKLTTKQIKKIRSLALAWDAISSQSRSLSLVLQESAQTQRALEGELRDEVMPNLASMNARREHVTRAANARSARYSEAKLEEYLSAQDIAMVEGQSPEWIALNQKCKELEGQIQMEKDMRPKAQENANSMLAYSSRIKQVIESVCEFAKVKPSSLGIRI